MLNLVETRNRHFIARCRQLMAETPAGVAISRRDIAHRAALSPAPCYYCSYEYALRVIRVLRHGRMPMRRDRRLEMYEEINSKINRLMERNPAYTLPRALGHVLASATASQFFISPATALSLAERLR
ncbi:MAG: hypothetical protein NC339_02510 [Muribaculaceae bacterium]|nr:hypothetical protein [Muribaculaceae bacterium]